MRTGRIIFIPQPKYTLHNCVFAMMFLSLYVLKYTLWCGWKLRVANYMWVVVNCNIGGALGLRLKKFLKNCVAGGVCSGTVGGKNYLCRELVDSNV